MARKNDYATQKYVDNTKNEIIAALPDIIANELAKYFGPVKNGNGNSENEGKNPQISEAEKQAKKAEREAKRLAYKQAKREENKLTKKENRLVAAQMRAEGKDPSNKRQWEAAKRAYIKANPLQ